MDLQGKHIVLGLTGGVACYKGADLARELIKAGATVQAVMTASAQRFVTPLLLQSLTGRPVATTQWDTTQPNAMAHINLSREADAILVAPATADFIARLAQGRCDELLSLLCVARPAERCGLFIAPAMNREMWAHPATQRNTQQVQQDGAVVWGPASGSQACGELGDGRMWEPEEIRDALVAHFQPKVLRGRTVLITAGPTFEPLDPVRGLTNRSSGKMGFALARAAAEAGAQVTLVAGPVHLPTPAGVQRLDVESAREMQAAVLPLAAQHDVFIATAAVADWRPVHEAQAKIKKVTGQSSPQLELTENPDVLAAVAALPKPPFCVGFAAETHDLERHARDKLQRKRLQLVVANHGPSTFGRDENQLLLVDAQGTRELPAADKLSLARALVIDLAQRLPPTP
ncbi:MAG: bifunctional phosphopantothenoylcysteine decarboxylase/phosphopantothenate--cysteine ligase CoaBC [Betaproteobacteria bacterium]|nr:bifunctional phosphopantothenoylcysteine decarboxylase/phosphopantothenate--cysteine ligase CoaBC [Betaproteobacteria bacterium]